MKLLVAGGSGFIGRHLIQRALEKGHRVTVVGRRPSDHPWAEGVRTLSWDTFPEALGEEPPFDGIVNLAGQPIMDYRWTPAVRREILNSRVETTEKIARAICSGNLQTRVWVNGSAMGYYGETGAVTVDETVAAGSGFLAQVCKAWEAAAMVASPHCSVILFRTGIVLGDGGALPKMVNAFRWGLGVVPGKNQGFPWIHVEDYVEALLFLLNAEEVTGPVNGVAPEPLTMGAFGRHLGKIMGRPFLGGAPGWVIRAILGTRAEVLLLGQMGVPGVLLKLGFRWQYPSLEKALDSLLGRP